MWGKIEHLFYYDLFFCINHWYLHTGGEGIMTLWRTEGKNWVNRTIHNHQKSPRQSARIFRPETPKISNFHTSSCRKKTHFKLPHWIITTTNVFSLHWTQEKKWHNQTTQRWSCYDVNYCDTLVCFHNFSTAVSAQHTSVSFFSFSKHQISHLW